MPTAFRRQVVAAVALMLGSLAAAPRDAVAAPPKISGISPFGLQRGKPGELTVNGSALGGNPRLVAPFAFERLSPGPAGSDASNAKFTIRIADEAPIGVYPVRIQTDEGLSNPFLFAVGQLPQVSEKEDNSTFPQAQAIAAPAVVEGQAAGNDVDYFRFPGKKGQRIVIDAQCARIGSGVDPSIRLTTVDRKFVASADDTPGLLTDARLFAILPADTDYVIELSDSRYQGGGRPIYRLIVGAVPAAEEVYPLGGRAGETVGFELRGGTLASGSGKAIFAASLAPMPGLERAVVRAGGKSIVPPWAGPALDVESLPATVVLELPELREAPENAPPTRGIAPVVFNGRIDPEKDEDRFVLAVTPGQKLRVAVEAAAIGSALDGTLQVLNGQGGVITSGDDTPLPPRGAPKAQAPVVTSPDPSVEFTVPAGQTEVTLALKDLAARGGTGYPYRITVTPVVPDFLVSLVDTEVNIPRGGSAGIAVTVVRKGYTGPIVLDVVDPPAGVVVRPGTIASGQLLGALAVSAAPDAAFGVASLRVVGKAETPAGPIVRRAEKEVVFAQQANLPTNTLDQQGIAAAPTVPAPLTIDAPAAPVEIAHGLGGPVKVTATRPKGAEGALTLAPLPLPPGLTAGAAKLDEKATETNVTFTTTTDHPLGTVSVVLTAKGKVGGADRSLAVPTITLAVVRPAEVQLAAPAAEIKAGATIEVKGKVVRKGTFADAVTVKLNGLPAGLKADPVTVAAGKTDFTMKVVADPKAAPATASATAALAFQINKKDYPAPTAALSVKVLPAK